MKVPSAVLPAFVVFSLITHVFAGQENEERLKLGYEMQEGVLKTQSLPKIRELLNRGVDINAPIGCGTYSPLDGAVNVQNPEMLKFLLAHGAKPLGCHLSAAAFASGGGQSFEMCKSLIESGVDPNTPGEDINALSGATFREHQNVVALLLAQPKINIDATDLDGYTPLMWAIKHGSLDLVDMLLKAGANPLAKNKRGEIAATIAQQEIKKQETILLQLGAKTK